MKQSRKHSALGLHTALAVLSCATALAQSYIFNIPQDEAVRTIPEFARQAGIEIIAPAAQLANLKTPALQGEMDVHEALQRLIASIGLEVASDNGRVIVLRVKQDKKARDVPTSDVLEEVIVTATRREARARDVALSITAIGQAQLQAMGADSFTDFYRSVPGLTFNQGDPGEGYFIIRGLNSGQSADNQAPVALYIDEFPTDDSRGARSIADLSLFDVQRIEVLRGPQGTLFGSGALGGAIRVITNKPDAAKFSTAVDADVSTINGGAGSYALRGMVNVPLFDQKVAVRLVGYSRSDGGYVNNVATGGHNVNSDTDKGGRVALKYFATDDLAVTATVVHQETDVSASGAVYLQPDGHFEDNNPLSNYIHSKLTTYNLLVDYDLRFARLMSSTTYGHKGAQLVQGFEGAFDGLPLITSGPDNGSSAAQELRLTSTGTGASSWVAGAFYLQRKRDVVSIFNSPGAGALLGAPTDTLLNTQSRIEDTERALYGEFAYRIAEHWQATVGLRWFQNTERYQDRQDGLLVPAPTVDGPLANTERQATPKFVLSYKPLPDALVYASAAKGYRIGGTDIPNPQDPAVPPRYKPDSLWNYELGAKTSWLDRRVSVDAAVYYIDWKDIQIERTSIVNNLGYVDNGGVAHSQGVELEINTKPARDWTVSTALSWNSAKSNQTVPNTNILYGDWLPGARDFTASTTVEYLHTVPLKMQFFARAEHQYVGKAYADFDTPVAPVEEPYQVVNFRFGLERDTWAATLYVENLLNDAHITGFNSTGGIGYRLKPRTMGLNFRTFLSKAWPRPALALTGQGPDVNDSRLSGW